MTTRKVVLGSMFYVDADGKGRWADHDAVVDVHPDNLERFDRVNVLNSAPQESEPEPDPEPEPVKRRPGRPRKDDID